MKKNNSYSNSELKTLAEKIYNSYKNNLPKYKFYVMEHRGGLKEALETLEQIDTEKYKKLYNDYEYYGYDDRINCLRYIAKDLEHTKKYDWLMISDLSLKEIIERGNK